MKHIALALAASLLCWGCTFTDLRRTSLQGQYDVGSYDVLSDLSYDEVWDRAINHFAQQGSFPSVDKSNGLIATNRVRWNAPLFTVEKNKKPVDPNAFVVISRCSWERGYLRKEEQPDYIEADWIIRIKKMGEQTSISVNLLNIYPIFSQTVYDYDSVSDQVSLDRNKVVKDCAFEVKSTGIFERTTAATLLSNNK